MKQNLSSNLQTHGINKVSNILNKMRAVERKNCHLLGIKRDLLSLLQTSQNKTAGMLYSLQYN